GVFGTYTLELLPMLGTPKSMVILGCQRSYSERHLRRMFWDANNRCHGSIHDGHKYIPAH
ncbi:hypothetical protein, partial [Sphingobacterium sp. JB170]|uniref:hypothetical protein n=1 Tax=Sphingobacterium sp. JB170 TaxID=1434842 RepID=UPI001C4F755E